MLRESNMRALLTENGFIDNEEDVAKLKSSSFIEQTARGHVNGLEKVLGLNRIVTGIPDPPEKERNEGGGIHKVSDWAKADLVRGARKWLSGRYAPLTREEAAIVTKRIRNNFLPLLNTLE